MQLSWCLNDAGINNPIAESTSASSPAIPLSIGDRLICYVKDNYGRFYASQPYVRKSPCKNCRIVPPANQITLSPSNLTFSSSGGSSSVQITSNNDWDYVSFPSWLNLTWDDLNQKLNINANTNTGGNRTATIQFVEHDNNTIISSLTITQAAAGGTTTPLSSLTPSSVYMPDWGTLQTNKSVEGNSLRIGGVTYASGLGTHASSNIKYNLGGQYTTFSGKVGLDDEVDGGCANVITGVQYVIKADGVTLWTSSIVTSGSSPSAPGSNENLTFSLDVRGRSQLELIVNPLDNYYCDHADWVDVQLVSGGGGGCPSIPNPTGVSASVGTITVGQSTTLSASCGQGSVVWSTGQTANAVTVTPSATTTYTATCVSGTCSSGSVSVTVVVASVGACSSLTNGLVVGTWLHTGQPLKVREFYGQKWLTQSAGTNPDVFVVRGSNMFLRSDVVLVSGISTSQMSCFAWQNSGFDGLGTPNEATFPTPSGYNLTYSDGTPVYTASGTPPTCTNGYVTAQQASSASSGDGVVRTNLNKNGTTLNINGTTYAKGIGTHAVSEIIYNVPSGQGFTTFMADVGRDQGAYGCGNCGAQDMVFKILNNTTGALLAGPVTKGNYQSATSLSANLSGVTSIKLIVEAGSDGLNWGDWANWANARFTCPNANARQINIETTESSLFDVTPNPNNGVFKINLRAPISGTAHFYLTNFNGVLLQSMSYDVSEGVSEHTISTQNLIPGTYLLKGVFGEQVESKRIIIE